MVTRPIRTSFLEPESEHLVRVPTVESLLGDKLTAFAPHTTGVPFYSPKSGEEQLQEVANNLFDVGVLFDVAADFGAVAKSYAAVSSLMPVAAGPYVPDAFTDTKDGRGITWGLCHITDAGARGKRHSILARFDCDLSRDVNDLAMKHTDIYLKPEGYFSQGLNKWQREQREKGSRQPKKP